MIKIIEITEALSTTVFRKLYSTYRYAINTVKKMRQGHFKNDAIEINAR